ncbi:MAG: aminodeoxychorismate/anthranilate synthase component II [Candidatus Omnitrophica bacterium]|nr:aminodeoxychorismate/anthranilate synthase component II [Candidatus Omnitrophota bacterium]
MILMIDNYDSFTYNIVQYFGELGAKVKVYRNDAITVDQIKALNPGRIVVSPGPSNPEHAGISVDVIREFAGKISILGVCLGHQAIGYAFGGKIVRAKNLMHGKTSRIKHDEKGLFTGLSNPFVATRYHSLVIDKATCPDCFEVTAVSEDDGEIMGICHKTQPIWGVQFHPESILTKEGKKILDNFLRL